jgi:outer membrane lipoprotein-sorting protein
MKPILFFLFCCFSMRAVAGDDSKLLIREINKKFAQVNDYTANVFMKFDIPGVKMNSLNGKVFFKSPNKFRIRTKGIFFLPKQNPLQNISTLLLDTSSYTSVISGYEILNGKNCAIVNIIPLTAKTELILGKFWIDTKNILILKSQITTKNNGTLETNSTYSSLSNYTLPDKLIIKVEIKKIKIPKMMSGDLNKIAKRNADPNALETGTIELVFSNYTINTKFPDTIFTEKGE